MISIFYTETGHESGYHYLITKNTYNWKAYKTKKGFWDFIKRHEIELTQTFEKLDIYGKKVKGFFSERNINDILFTDIKQIPVNAKKYIDFSNGSLVDCYHTRDSIYRPNPNYKEIYKPLDIKEHIAYQYING